MSVYALFILAIGLSMDAFAVAVCKGLAMNHVSFQKAAIVGLWFGGFQAGMPFIGYLLGTRFENKIINIDHWIAFALLGFIGINMIREAFSKGEKASTGSLAFREMFPLAIATSIDALAVGVTFAFLQVPIVSAVSFIGIITFLFSCIGVKIGNAFGTRYKSKAECAGGVILLLLGCKIVLEHLGIL